VLSKARNNNLSEVRQEAARHVVELEPDNSGMPQEMRGEGGECERRLQRGALAMLHLQYYITT
jgi:hypothetical protein